MTQLTYVTCDDQGLTDWDYLGTGADYDSYFITGYKLHGQGQRQFQSNYLYLFSEAQEGSSVKLRYRWDYTTASGEHRWSSEEEGYRHQANRSYVTKRMWLRGQGLALQISVRSSEDKPFTVIGYSVFETGNSNV